MNNLNNNKIKRRENNNICNFVFLDCTQHITSVTRNGSSLYWNTTKFLYRTKKKSYIMNFIKNKERKRKIYKVKD